MVFERVVAANAGVELVATEMFYGDDVKRRVPVAALCERCDSQAVHLWFNVAVGSHGAGGGVMGTTKSDMTIAQS